MRIFCLESLLWLELFWLKSGEFCCGLWMFDSALGGPAGNIVSVSMASQCEQLLSRKFSSTISRTFLVESEHWKYLFSLTMLSEILKYLIIENKIIFTKLHFHRHMLGKYLE